MAGKEGERAARLRLEERDQERTRHLAHARKNCAVLQTELVRLERVKEREREMQLERTCMHDDMAVCSHTVMCSHSNAASTFVCARSCACLSMCVRYAPMCVSMPTLYSTFVLTLTFVFMRARSQLTHGAGNHMHMTFADHGCGSSSG